MASRRALASVDLRRLWEPRDSPTLDAARKTARKACRKRVKLELSLVRGPSERDALRRAWVGIRCRACGACPKFTAKLSS